MRLTLPNGISYDLNAMLTPKLVGRAEAWLRFRKNLQALPKATVIPFKFPFSFPKMVNWLIVLTVHVLSLALLPVLCLFGYSMKSYALLTTEESQQLEPYREALKAIYRKHQGIDDIDVYKKRVQADIALLKSIQK